MPVFATRRTIAISHPILIKEITSRDVGQMSLELMDWFTKRLYLAQAIESGNDNTASTRLRAFRDPKVTIWNDRCLLAASRGYRPPFVDHRTEFTSLGREKAHIIQKLFMEATSYQLEQSSPHANSSTYDPNYQMTIEELPINRLVEKQFWTKAEHCFLSMEITIRQYNMLRMLEKALSEAEQTNRTKLDIKYQSAKSAQMLDEFAEITQEELAQEELARLDAIRAQGTAGSIFDELADQHTSQSFQAIMLNPGKEEYDMLTPDLSRPMPKEEAYVPTAMFGQRARNDLNVLVKYGLVDLRALRTGVRGRPRHIVRVSEVGSILINDQEVRAEL